jgi:hypothetical protein
MKTMTSPSTGSTQEMTSSEALLNRFSELEEAYKKSQENYKKTLEDLDRAYLIIRQLKQQHFGRKSEKLDVDLPLLPALNLLKSRKKKLLNRRQSRKKPRKRKNLAAARCLKICRGNVLSTTCLKRISNASAVVIRWLSLVK